MMTRLGILGGMGPIASAEFVRTIYDVHPSEREQDLPVCFLYSDPAFPDRTEAIERGDEENVSKRLADAISKLLDMGADRVVIACFTAHHFLPRIPGRLADAVISLIDVAVDEIAGQGQPVLLLCTNGSRSSRLFERAARWSEASRWVRYPDDDDQQLVHKAIYRLKQHADVELESKFFRSLLDRYRVSRLVAGCTELHLLARSARSGSKDTSKTGWLLDPLMQVAENLREWLDPTSRPKSSRVAAHLGNGPSP